MAKDPSVAVSKAFNKVVDMVNKIIEAGEVSKKAVKLANKLEDLAINYTDGISLFHTK